MADKINDGGPAFPAHTPLPWQVFRVKQGPNMGNLLGVGDSDGSGIYDAFGGVWGSGAEKKANEAILAEVRAEYDAVIAAKTPADQRNADDAFLAKVNECVARMANSQKPMSIQDVLTMVVDDECFGQLEPFVQRAVLAARAKGGAQ